MESQGTVQTEMCHLPRDRPRGYQLGWAAVKSAKRWICTGIEGKRGLTGRYGEERMIRQANRFSPGQHTHKKEQEIRLCITNHELSALMPVSYMAVFRDR